MTGCATELGQMRGIFLNLLVRWFAAPELVEMMARTGDAKEAA